MSHVETFALPDVGEGLTEAEILDWRVQPGDEVGVNQILVEIETAKAAVELPSPFAGRVTSLLVTQGQTVDVGVPIITIDTDPGGDATAPVGRRGVRGGHQDRRDDRRRTDRHAGRVRVRGGRGRSPAAADRCSGVGSSSVAGERGGGGGAGRTGRRWTDPTRRAGRRRADRCCVRRGCSGI